MNHTDNQQTEKIFYQDNNVLVTQSRFIANNKTYAMRNISSVSNYRITKNSTGIYLLIFIGIIVLIAGGNGILWGLLLIGVGITLIMTMKDDFSVQINSNSGESKALISKDQMYIQKIVDAINDAIIHRG